MDDQSRYFYFNFFSFFGDSFKEIENFVINVEEILEVELFSELLLQPTDIDFSEGECQKLIFHHSENILADDLGLHDGIHFVFNRFTGEENKSQYFGLLDKSLYNVTIFVNDFASFFLTHLKDAKLSEDIDK